MIEKRDEKIMKLKNKILNEIDALLKKYKTTAVQAESSMETFEFVIKNSFVLLKLKDYVSNTASFNQMRDKNYIISNLHIDMWLQEDYDFVFDFLSNAEDHDYNVIPLLNDNFFESYFTDIVDEILYKQKDKLTGRS